METTSTTCGGRFARFPKGQPYVDAVKVYVDPYIDVCIDENSDLLFSGQDTGDASEEMIGDIDNEYWLTMPAVGKYKPLQALIEKSYAGDALVVSRLRDLMESRVIPHELSSY